MAVTVFLFQSIVSVPKLFQVTRVGLLFLNRELFDGICSYFEWDLDDFRILDGARNLMSADGRAGESPISGGDLTLRVADLNESPRSRRISDGRGRHAEGVAAGRQFFRSDNDAASAMRELQVSASVTMR